MFDEMTITQFESWLTSEDEPKNQAKSVASFIGTLDFVELDTLKRDITCHYLANLVLTF